MGRIIHFVLTELIDYIVALIISAISILTITQVFLRYVMNSPLFWSEELTRYLIIWLTFLGAGLGVRHRGHITVEFLARMFPLSFQRILNFGLDILIISYLLILCWLGVKVMKVFMVFKSSALSIPQGYIFLAVPVGAAIMIYHKVRQILKTNGSR